MVVVGAVGSRRIVVAIGSILAPGAGPKSQSYSCHVLELRSGKRTFHLVAIGWGMSESAASESVLERIVSRTRRLYSLPAVASRILELTSQEQVDLRAIKECIEKDPALVAKLLRVANSSLFGLRSEVSNLNQAIGLLGVRSLKMLVLGFSLPSELSRDVPATVLERFWRQTVYRAVAARCFAQRFWQLPGDDAFLAGLLSGIGMLALIQDLGEPYTQFLDHVYEHGGDVAEQEIAVLGFDHAVLSAKMLENWHLPESLVHAVARPRQIPRLLALPQGEQALAAVLHVADLAAEFLVTARPAKLQALLAACHQLKGLSCEQVRLTLGKLEHEVAELAELFKVSSPEIGSFDQLFARAQASLSELAEASVLGLPDDEAQLAHVLREAIALQRELGSAVAKRSWEGPPIQRRADAPVAEPLPPVSSPPLPRSTDVRFSSRVAASIESCRNQRCPISLVMVTIDRYSDLVVSAGIEPARQFVRWLERLCITTCDRPTGVVAVGDARFALLLEDHDRPAAVAVGRQLLDTTRKHVRTSSHDAIRAAKISAGVATLALPPRNFPAAELIEAAGRCLQAAQTSGGDTVKSIEI
jgi:HD-like signal output (HDOD) protein/GGDEF domain-containing protein